jgi:methionyl aminopeptidase
MSATFEASLDVYAQAGVITAQLRSLARKLVVAGAKILGICEALEGEIRERGARPAFPVNVCVGSVAAHFTAPPEGEDILNEGDLVKVDFGAMIDGYLVDTAVTVNLSPIDAGIVEAVEACLDVAIGSVRSGIDISKVGAAVQRRAEAAGFKVIANLTGHEITRYNLHAGGIMPNVSQGYGGKVRPYTIYAIEPFLTYSYGAGFVVERRPGYIFRLGRSRPKGAAARELQSRAHASFDGLPFAERWLGLSSAEGRAAFGELVGAGCVSTYPQLVEKNGAPVAQAEHTVAVLPDKVVVLTR